MTKTFVVALLPACALAGSALVAAPGQTYPGQPTQGHVMIDNKGPGQTIPVAVQHAAADENMLTQRLVVNHDILAAYRQCKLEERSNGLAGCLFRHV